MFNKRKKTFAPGTFIPFPSRIIAILQLCIVFTVIVWTLSIPFMGDLFAYKSKILLYQDFMGNDSYIKKLDVSKANQLKDRLNQNADRFKALPQATQTQILKDYNQLQEQVNSSFLIKLGQSFHILAFELPPIELAWIFFSVVISLLLLLRIEGAAQTAWLLPLIVILFTIDNQWHGNKSLPSVEESLFPSEDVIINHYLGEPLENSITAQREQLLKGWQIYLIKNWGHEEPSHEPEIFKNQAEKGEYAFNLARLEGYAELKEGLAGPSHYTILHTKRSAFLLCGYFFWNLFFAWFVNRRKALILSPVD